jgi:hypothetical protein
MKIFNHFAILALSIGMLSACNSEGTKNTTPVVGNSAESIGEVNSSHEEAENTSESYTLITDNGVGVENNQNTEKPENF